MRTLLATLGLVIALPAAALAQSPSPAPVAGADHLGEAVAFLPPGATSLGFTDWSRVRASLGAEGVTGASPFDDKADVVLATSGQEAAGSAFGAAYLQRHHEAWGWDTLDVDWEATYAGDGPPVFLVRLREGTDVAAIAARYDAYGFPAEDADGATIRSLPLDPAAEWMGTTELAVTNTAFLDDGRTLAFSASPDALRAALGQAARTPLPGQDGVVDALAGASAAWLVLAPDCLAFSPLPIDPFDPDATIGPMPTGAPLHPWTALGVGYGRPGWDPVGRIAMGFLEPGHAEADASARIAGARDGTSQRTGRPYAESVFTVADARVDGSTLVMGVRPADDRTPRLFQMVFARDASFAGC